MNGLLFHDGWIQLSYDTKTVNISRISVDTYKVQVYDHYFVRDGGENFGHVWRVYDHPQSDQSVVLENTTTGLIHTKSSLRLLPNPQDANWKKSPLELYENNEYLKLVSLWYMELDDG
tara:strand:+ start:139 stop:492 length:354 start_codon:yes stop_codon:yes gene_type:complete